MLNPKKTTSVVLNSIAPDRHDTHTLSFYLNLTITGGKQSTFEMPANSTKKCATRWIGIVFLFAAECRLRLYRKLDGLTPTREFGCANYESSRWLHELFITCKDLCWLFQQFCLHGLWFNVHSRGSWFNVTSKILNPQITWYITFVAA